MVLNEVKEASTEVSLKGKRSSLGQEIMSLRWLADIQMKEDIK